MRFNEYSHRHGRELFQVLKPDLYKEVVDNLSQLEPFNHGEQKGITIKNYMSNAFLNTGWEKELKVDFKTDKDDFLDLYKDKIAIEMEYSRFEMFFRDFFRFMLLYERGEIDLGIIITFDEMAYQRWSGEAKPYKSARASLNKVVDFLQGDYSSIIRVPIWCIGIE